MTMLITNHLVFVEEVWENGGERPHILLGDIAFDPLCLHHAYVQDEVWMDFMQDLHPLCHVHILFRQPVDTRNEGEQFGEGRGFVHRSYHFDIGIRPPPPRVSLHNEGGYYMVV
jgi:hypothetical protein